MEYEVLLVCNYAILYSIVSCPSIVLIHHLHFYMILLVIYIYIAILTFSRTLLFFQQGCLN